MLSLPLYPQGNSTPVDRTASLPLNSKCTLCPLHDGTPSVRRCKPAEGTPGGAMLLFKSPTSHGFAKGDMRDFLEGVLASALNPDTWNSATGMQPPALSWDTALRCEAIQKGGPEEAERCRGYLARSLADVKPSRILAFGPTAVHALLGTSPPLDSARRGYAHTEAGVPVFLLRPLEAVYDNAFTRREWAEDVRWALRASPPGPPLDGRALLVRTVADALEAVRALYKHPWCAWDTETFGRPYDDCFAVISVALASPKSRDAWVWDRAALEDPAVRAPLLALLEDPDIEKVAMNSKFDGIAARCGFGIEVQSNGRDIGLRRSLIDPEALTRLEVQQYLVGMGGSKRAMDDAVEGAVVRVKRMAGNADQGVLFGGDCLPRGVNLAHVLAKPRAYAYAFVDRSLLSIYNALDAVSTARLELLHTHTLAQPSNASLQYVWDELVSAASEAIEQVEAWGIGASREAITSLVAYAESRLALVEKRLALYGLHKPGSPDQVAEVLYDKLKLEAPEDRSTAEEVLELLADKHPAVGDVLEWRGFDKIRGMYGKSLLLQITRDGRIHVDFRIDGARSGRMSAGGGLHGLPRPETPEGVMVRDCFVARPGYVLRDYDLSQAELRGLAGLSGDPVMVDTFRRDIDIHRRTAEGIARRVWNIDPAMVQDIHRSQAKIINLALIYGRGDKALAAEITAKSGVPCTKEQAAEIREAVLGNIHVANSFMRDQLTFAQRHGYARTFLRGKPARRRPLSALGLPDTRANRGPRGHAERGASNTPVQGTTADIVFLLLIAAVRAVKRSKLRATLGLTTHDSMTWEVHEEDEQALDDLLQPIFRSEEFGNGVPVVVDCKRGKAYGSLVKVKKTPSR